MAAFSIIGAGPVGALMALLLARRGHAVRLYERRPDPRGATTARGRSINLALSARGLRALQLAGLLEGMRDSLIAMPGRMLHDEQGRLEFQPYGRDANEVNYAISRGQVNRILIDAAAAHPKVELLFQQRCVDLDPDAGTIRWRDERSGQVRQEPMSCVLACDGASSAVRHALAERGLIRVLEQPLPHDYKELLIPPLSRAGAGDGYAFEPHALHIWPRGGFMLIALPNPDRSFTATLFLPQTGPDSFEQLDHGEAVQKFFQREFADAAAVTPDLIEQFRTHPSSHLGTVACDRWYAGGPLLLLGDAAHAMVPFHGQGLNCGFEDCVVLDALLQQHSSLDQAFRAFERSRIPDSSAIAAMALENYVEMRAEVRSPQFVRRKALAAQLERWFPQRFIPRYSMVTFHPEISYAEARRRGERQEQMLDSVLRQFPDGALPPESIAAAEQWLLEAGL
jgi:kynurenine 3-monooxygenase